MPPTEAAKGPRGGFLISEASVDRTTNSQSHPIFQITGLGWPVFPVFEPSEGGGCSCGGAECKHIGKHPRTGNGFKSASTLTPTINNWLRKWPYANFGIATGTPSELFVLDIDPRHAGDDSFQKLQEKYGPLPSTVSVKTGGGGFHFYFNTKGIEPIKAAKLSGYPGIDIKSEGGYVICPPSLHASGQHYEWISTPGETPLAPIPTWLIELLSSPIQKLKTATPHSHSEKSIPEGERNNRLASIAGKLRSRGHGVDAITAQLNTINENQCVVPLPPNEIASISQSISQYPVSGLFHLTDQGNAERMMSKFSDVLRYVPGLAKWIYWNGTCWKHDADGEATRYAVKTIDDIRKEAEACSSLAGAEALIKHAHASEREARIKSMITLAHDLPNAFIHLNQLDSDPFLFNCKNGTIDLRTGELRPHNQGDFITKVAPCDYDPNARSETWERFLGDVTQGDTEFQEFLQRYMGYSLTGSTKEECLAYLFGPTSSGKSTFIIATRRVWGPYAVEVNFDTFAKKNPNANTGPTPELARLNGARAVFSNELDEGKELAESLMKNFVSGETINARPMYGNPFEFIPTAKLFIAANNRAKVRHEDAAMWRRILQIPFVNSIPAEKRDPNLKLELTNTAISGAAILGWAVRGCLEWQRQGLKVPQAVKAATEEYKTSMNPLVDFLADDCEIHPDLHVPAGSFYTAYTSWAQRNGEKRPIGSKRFKTTLEELGFLQKRLNTGRVWTGVSPKGTSAGSVVSDGSFKNNQEFI